MRAAIAWEPPSTAQAHLSLRQAASKKGFDDLSLRQLLRLINAHPRCVAHGRVLSNIASLLAHIATSSVGPLGPWAIYLDQWIKIAQWAAAQAPYLSHLPGLKQFDEQPQHTNDHPVLGEGVDRHGIVAALWNRHESCEQYPPEPENEPGWRYFRLQAHLLYSYIDARWRWVPLDYYESYEGSKERPVAPALTGPASRAVREFSLARYDSFLTGVNPELPVPEFYQHLRDAQSGINTLSQELKDKAEIYLVILQRYFKWAWRIHAGRRPRTTLRIGGGGGPGSKARIPGFISVVGTQLLLKSAPKVRSIDADEDSWPPVGTLYWGPSDTEEEVDVLTLEKSGLDPAEDLEPILELVDAEQYAKKMHGAHYGHLAREMAAQSYFWDWGKLSQGELHGLWTSLDNSINAAYHNPSNVAKARYKHIAALMLKFMLLFGQSCERACALRIQWIAPDGIFTISDPGEIEHPTLFVLGNKDKPSASDQIIGFGLPALSPIYKTQLDEKLDDFSRQLADGLVLPDLSNLGQQLLAFHFSESEQDEQVFHINLPTAEEKLKALLRTMDARITPARITRTLPALLTKQSGDVSLAWVTFAMTDCQNESRMHYTMHSTNRIRQAYAGAASAFLRAVGHQPIVFKPDPKPRDPMHIGCRFVLGFSPLKQLIADLKDGLTKRYGDNSSLAYVVQYDRDYLFYTFLMLTISTCTRAIKKPVSLFREWQETGQCREGIVSGLWDKESMFFDKSRLITVPPQLTNQFRHYQLHIEFFMSQLMLTGMRKLSAPEDQILVTFDKKFRPKPLTPSWIKARFEDLLGAPVPANFSRAFMRTELLERGVAAELIDAFLGHSNEGESPFTQLSTFDYEHYICTLSKAITGILNDLGLVPIESRIVTFPTRLGAR